MIHTLESKLGLGTGPSCADAQPEASRWALRRVASSTERCEDETTYFLASSRPHTAQLAPGAQPTMRWRVSAAACHAWWPRFSALLSMRALLRDWGGSNDTALPAPSLRSLMYTATPSKNYTGPDGGAEHTNNNVSLFEARLQHAA